MCGDLASLPSASLGHGCYLWLNGIIFYYFVFISLLFSMKKKKKKFSVQIRERKNSYFDLILILSFFFPPESRNSQLNVPELRGFTSF